MIPCDVLVVGGGIVGLASALACAQKNLKVAVLDRNDLGIASNPNNTRVYAINSASKTVLEQLGVWQHLSPSFLSPYTSMQVWEAKGGTSIQFDARLIASPQLGFILEESLLKNALFKQIEQSQNISLFPFCTIDKIMRQPDRIEIRAGDRIWSGQLLMGTDGAHSSIRDLLQVALTTWPYHQYALIATVHTEKPHQKTAYQVFHSQGPLAFLPLANPHHCSIVWTTTKEESQNLMHFSEESFNTALKTAFAATLGKTTLISQRHYFPLTMRHVQQYTGDRWILLGDAAHTIHPLAGLGLNLGLADLTTWLNYSQNTPLNAKIPLARYQRNRKHEVWQVIALMQALKHLFETDNTPLAILRNLGIRAIDNFSPMKRLLIRQAAGEVVK
jgi:2-polyprenylphenol 6-hydroxylase